MHGEIALVATGIGPIPPLCIYTATACRRSRAISSQRLTILSMPRTRLYFLLMGSCLTLIVLAWFVVRLFSTPVAIAMSVVALVIPPVAAMIGNRS